MFSGVETVEEKLKQNNYDASINISFIGLSSKTCFINKRYRQRAKFVFNYKL